MSDVGVVLTPTLAWDKCRRSKWFAGQVHLSYRTSCLKKNCQGLLTCLYWKACWVC